MSTRFCAHCGAKVVTEANFCVECGEQLPGGGGTGTRPGWAGPLQRYAPVLIIATVILVGGGAVVVGYLNPKAQPTVPGRNAGAPEAAGAAANLPQGHPPIAIPEEVKQTIRDMAQKAAAAPDDLDAWKRVAEVQYRAGQLEAKYLDDAAASYRHVLEREPTNTDALRNLGNIAFDQDQQATAIGYYQQYLKQKPDDLNVQTDLGTMYLESGKPDEAQQQFESALKTDPKFFQAQFNLAIVYRTKGDNEQALAALNKARTLATDDKTRTQVDQVIAHLTGAPAAAPPMAGGAAASTPGAGSSFQTALDEALRQTPVLGPKIQRVEWSGPADAKVYVAQFPMDQMPPEMREMFTSRMRDRVKEQKESHQIAGPTTIAFVDADSGRVLDTLTE